MKRIVEARYAGSGSGSITPGAFGAKVGHLLGLGLPIRLHVRSDLHLARKTWHAIMGSVIAFLYLAGISRSTGIMILGSLLGFDLFMEMARLKSPAFNEKLMRIWGPFMRSCEINRVSGIPYYLASTIIAIGLFPQPIAVLSILFLAWGDPIASLFGILYGKKGLKFASGKSVVGTAAGILTCMLVSLIYLKTLDISDSALVILTLVGGVAGGTAELLPFDLDDNFTIPVISGFVLWLAFILVRI